MSLSKSQSSDHISGGLKKSFLTSHNRWTKNK
jgi:hypothetical protein